MRLSHLIAVAACLVLPAAFASAQEGDPPPLPEFGEAYPAEPLGDRARQPVKIGTTRDSNYSTRLHEAAERDPNFAGTHRLELWGCGTDCLIGAAVDLLTGDVNWVPAVISCAWCGEYGAPPFDFRPDSHMLILRGKLHPDGVNGEHYYVLDYVGFVHLRTVPFD